MNLSKDIFRMLIFTVDDEDYNTYLMEELLLEAGFENIKKFSSAHEVLDTLNAGEIPDLILSDIMMPKMNGYELCAEVKSKQAWSHIPFIMITAAPMEESVPLKLSFEAGAMDFLSKPVNEMELILRVKSALILEKQRKELQSALEEVKTLRGLFPICSYCKKIRDDKDYWTEIETYIATHSDAQFSHSVCPSCYEKYVKPELEEMKKLSKLSKKDE